MRYKSNADGSSRYINEREVCVCARDNRGVVQSCGSSRVLIIFHGDLPLNPAREHMETELRQLRFM